MNPSEISSLQNPKVKHIIKLRKRRTRDMENEFLIEGFRELTRAIEAGKKVTSLFYSPDLFLGTQEPALIQKIAQLGGELYLCPPNVFQKLSYRDRPDGLMAIAPQEHLSLQTLTPRSSPPLFVVAEAIEKPGNLGTILRSSDATGVDAAIICDRCTDIYNPNVVRASVGTLFTLPVIETTTEEALDWFHKEQVTIVAATPAASLTYTEADLSGPLAIAVGTEQIGLSKQWMERANLQVSIPMRGKADSLNVAMATTLLLYEALRQRGSS